MGISIALSLYNIHMQLIIQIKELSNINYYKNYKDKVS